MEARAGIEPTNGAFAELCLTGWLPRRKKMLGADTNGNGLAVKNF